MSIAFKHFLSTIDPDEALYLEENGEEEWLDYIGKDRLITYLFELRDYGADNKEEIMETMKVLINQYVHKFCTNDNTYFYKLLVEFGLDVEKHKEIVQNKKIVPFVNTVRGGFDIHQTTIIGIYDNEEEALHAVIKYMVVHCEFYDYHYQKKMFPNGDFSIRMFEQVRQAIKNDAEELTIRFKSGINDKIKYVCKEQYKLYNELNNSYYWGFDEV